MENLLVFDNVNWLAVLVAAVLAFVIGGIWYGSLFKEQWLVEQKFSKQQMTTGLSKEAQAKTSLVGLVINIGQALVLALLLNGLSVTTAGDGLLFGLLIGLVFAVATLAINFMYSMKTMRLFAIDAGYMLAYFGVMGLVLAIWQ